MIKLKDLISEQHDEEESVDMDRLIWNDGYLDDIAEKMGYDDDFTKQFWNQHYLPTLYHCTTEENYEKVKVEGLKQKQNTRGAISNRHIGPAVFTTQEEVEISSFKDSYGPVVIAINIKKMKSDGFTPEVQKEPDWARAEKLEFVLRKMGQENAEASRFVDSSDQTSPGTIIIYSRIPPKYLSLVEYHD